MLHIRAQKKTKGGTEHFFIVFFCVSTQISFAKKNLLIIGNYQDSALSVVDQSLSVSVGAK
jgi:hypothetical protein